VLFERTDARNAKKVFKFIEEPLLIATREVDCRGSHGYVPFL
jgi:hypothetical protein